MNIATFNRIIRPIEREVEYTLFSLDFDNKFPNKTRTRFNIALNDLFSLIESNLYAPVDSPSWHTARRIVQLNKLYIKIERIRQKVFIHCQTPYFANKIKRGILPALAWRIKDLRIHIGSLRRLPFFEGIERFKYHRNVKECLQLLDASKTIEVEKEYFHLLGNHLDEKKVQEINVDFYGGSLEVFSLESWSQVLDLFVQQGDASEKIIGDWLLSIMRKAIPLALKTSFALSLPQLRRPLDEQDELGYFEDLANSSMQLEPGEKSEMTAVQFFEKYRLANPCPIPESVVINEMAWDMLDTIKKMQRNDIHLFSLGICTHSIVVQVFCITPATLINPGNYKYTIFNTGRGVDRYHQLDASGEYAYPLSFEGLPQRAFSYFFFSYLLRLSLEKTSIDDFYQYHNQILVERFGGKRVSDGGNLYLLQKWGTCTYSAMEAWIDSFLTLAQKTHLDFLKTQMSTQKQAKVVEILEERVKQSSNWMIVKKGKSIPNPLSEDSSKKLQESQLLLELGRNYLQQVINQLFVPVMPLSRHA